MGDGLYYFISEIHGNVSGVETWRAWATREFLGLLCSLQVLALVPLGLVPQAITCTSPSSSWVWHKEVPSFQMTSATVMA